MKKIYFAGILLLFIMNLQGCQNEEGEELSDIDFSVLHSSDTLADGIFSMIGTSKGTKVITSQNDYETELLKYSDDEAVSIDFDKSSVLLVDMGKKSTTGYSITVSSIKQDNNSVIVTVLLTKLGKYCVGGTAITNPFQFVEIPTKKSILINEELILVCNGEPATNVDELLPNIEFSVLHGYDTANGAYYNKRTKVLTSQYAYETELLKYSDDAAVSIDFDKSSVLLVDMGQQSSTGYSITVSSIKEDNDSVIVRVLSTEPSKYCFVGAEVINPFQFVEIPTKKTILINEELIADKECSNN